MKRLLLVLTFLLVSGFSFAQDYGFKLFPWNTSGKEITQLLLSSGWTCRTDNTFIYFSPGDQNYFYHNKLLKIKEYFFSLNSDGTISSQNFTVDYDYTLPVAFMSLLSAITDDNCTLYSNNYETENNMDYFTYEAHLQDCDAVYIIYGHDDYYMMTLSYRNLN